MPFLKDEGQVLRSHILAAMTDGPDPFRPRA